MHVVILPCYFFYRILRTSQARPKENKRNVFLRNLMLKLNMRWKQNISPKIGLHLNGSKLNRDGSLLILCKKDSDLCEIHVFICIQLQVFTQIILIIAHLAKLLSLDLDP